MRQKKIATIRKTLVNKLEHLWSNARQTRTTMKNAEGTLADPFDLAAMESNKYVELACRDRERVLMLDIQETILRIDHGVYGICDSCARGIDEKRLLIEPMSKFCTQCQEEKEMSLKRRNACWGVKGMPYSHV